MILHQNYIQMKIKSLLENDKDIKTFVFYLTDGVMNFKNLRTTEIDRVSSYKFTRRKNE